MSAYTIEVLENEMALSLSTLKKMADGFEQEMVQGLAGESRILKMLSTYIGRPTGDEKGIYAALDFGGTNVRVMLVELRGAGNYEVLKKVSFPLRDSCAGYDYTSSCVTCEDLFAFIARKIKMLIDDNETYRLGHTFSFPCKSRGLNEAYLINWTKEFETSGVEGRDIGIALQEALELENVHNVKPSAIINDTVGTLLTAAYQEQDCDIATVLGTGHNTCYVERNNPWSINPMIVNIEAGNFNRVPQMKYDLLLDEASERPGEQLLEKMVSGRYLGELVRLMLLDLNESGAIFAEYNLKNVIRNETLTTADISTVLENEGQESSVVINMLKERYSLNAVSVEDIKVLQTVCRLVRNRSARLAAATYLGILQHIDAQLMAEHIIAVDGTLYEKMFGYAQELKAALQELLEKKNNKIGLIMAKDGSGIGAAIAAGMV
ncbi:MAG: hexokinase [Firmicutes bacterium HGW-Firmicutes-12]|jgi:hexokinase|nr:MAG: hexokinase [Firmicutes bacterium HGW-Firmicutes-12]